MASLSFRGKAALISLAFGLPLLCLFASFLADAQSSLDVLRRERLGISVVRQMTELQDALLSARNNTRALLGGLAREQGLQEAKQAVDAALQALRQNLDAEGDSLGLHAEVEALQAAWSQARLAPSGVDERGRTVFGPVSAALVKLQQKAGDQSALVLDSELDSFYLVDALVQTLPKLSEDLAQLWGWSSYAAAKGGLSNEEAQSYRLWVAGAGHGLQALRDKLARAAQARAELAQRLPWQALERAEAYRAQLMDPSALGSQRQSAQDSFAEGESVMQGLRQLGRVGLQRLDELLAQREAAQQRKRVLLIALTLVCLGLAGFLFRAFFIVTSGGLVALRAAFDAMRQGDLSRNPSVQGRDELAEVLRDLASLQNVWSEIVAQVRESSECIAAASAEMADGAQDLSSRTEKGAANLQQSAAAMEQIGATVQQTAALTQEAARLAGDNREVAQRGSQQVAEVLNSMDEMQGAARQIAAITGLIESIAFQTSILALNAAVEAARAGEHGRGFAVVATEVRALAGRAADASQQIKQIADGSLASASTGQSRVRAADATLQQLREAAVQMQTLLAEIAQGAQMQSQGVAQVGDSVQTLDQMTQQNAALVEQAAASMGALQQQAQQLSAGVARFKLRR